MRVVKNLGRKCVWCVFVVNVKSVLYVCRYSGLKLGVAVVVIVRGWLAVTKLRLKYSLLRLLEVN